MLILAVDPGLSGAIALLGDDWAKVLDLPTVPLEGNGSITRRVHGPGLQQLLLEHIPDGEDDVRAVMELLSPGGQENRVQTSISQGRSVGTIEAILECMVGEVERVYSRTWKSHYGLVGKKSGENEEKKAREIATALYPALGFDLHRACDHNRAESVLLGHFYRSTRT